MSLLLGTRYNKPLPLLKTFESVNVVMHMSLHGRSHRLRSLITPPPPIINSLKVDNTHLSVADSNASFDHTRYSDPLLGKILLFKKETRGQSKYNLIRPGQTYPADGILCVLMFLKWNHDLSWPTTIKIPNIVYTGEFKTPIPRGVYKTENRRHHRATKRDTYHGVTIKLQNTACKFSLAMKSNKFILPGTTSVPDVYEAFSQLSKIFSEV